MIPLEELITPLTEEEEMASDKDVVDGKAIRLHSAVVRGDGSWVVRAERGGTQVEVSGRTVEDCMKQATLAIETAEAAAKQAENRNGK